MSHRVLNDLWRAALHLGPLSDEADPLARAYAAALADGTVTPDEEAQAALVALSDTSEFVRRTAARAFRHPPAIGIAARHDDVYVREGVALNPRCPSGLLRGLAADPELAVRLAAVQNPNCPADALADAAASRISPLSSAALRHPRCPEHAKAFVSLSR